MQSMKGSVGVYLEIGLQILSGIRDYSLLRLELLGCLFLGPQSAPEI